MKKGIPLIVKPLILRLLNEYGISMNGIVYNVYSSKKSHIWWHTDLQPGIADIVVTLTTGRTAILEFREMFIKPNHTHKQNINENEKNNDSDNNNDNDNDNDSNENNKLKENEIISRVCCKHGTLVIMGPGVNYNFQHRIDIPTENELLNAMKTFGNIDRENITFHYHFNQTIHKQSFLNFNPANIKRNLTFQNDNKGNDNENENSECSTNNMFHKTMHQIIQQTQTLT